MATQGQLDFVHDIEAGVAALLASNQNVTKITQVTEAAGRNLIEVSAYVGRLAQMNEWNLVYRLAEAFSKVNLAPICITRVLKSDLVAPKKQIDLITENIEPEALELERSLPSIPQQLEELDRVFDVQYATEVKPSLCEPAQVLQKTIQLLSPYKKSTQQHVISTLGVWFGVGT